MQIFRLKLRLAERADAPLFREIRGKRKAGRKDQLLPARAPFFNFQYRQLNQWSILSKRIIAIKIHAPMTAKIMFPIIPEL